MIAYILILFVLVFFVGVAVGLIIEAENTKKTIRKYDEFINDLI